MDLVRVLGLAAAAFTTFSFFPQAVKVIRTRNTEGISLVMYLMFNIGITLWLIYGIMLNDLPIILANAITLFPALTVLFLVVKSKAGRGKGE
ncbi:MAG: SemiSWEET family sugar transporter [Bacteroidales bacterium]|nr:SemiSWEET family sugar transporter [Bacteroidales bacterium]MBN2749886.1 SemiSWEET family sugar transporter [Bacteroidales bacterium]